MNDKLKRINNDQIVAAGPRYSPGIDPAAPNLEVSEVLEFLEAAAFSSRIRQQLNQYSQAIRAQWDDPHREILQAFRNRQSTPGYLAELLQQLSAGRPEEAGIPARKLRSATNYVVKRLAKLKAALYKQERTTSDDTEENRRVRYIIHEVHQLDIAIEQLYAFIDRPAFGLLRSNVALILGEWGTGKTHSLCDFAKSCMDRGVPVLFMLSENLAGTADPIADLCRVTRLARSEKDLLEKLQRLTKGRSDRALLIIDAINEGSKEAWRSKIPVLLRRMDDYPKLALVLSCRIPFDRQLISKTSRRRFNTIIHFGFEDKEFDAQLEFFRYYDIPAPSFPLLAPEFSRPLFLKLLCLSLLALSSSYKARTLTQIVSGQKGMNYLLESFVKRIGRPIEDAFGLPPLTCWRILKGHRVRGGNTMDGIAARMAEGPREEIWKLEGLEIVQSLTGVDETTAGSLLDRMIGEGILMEALRENEGRYDPVLRFPYQRFGDHIVARHLLANHLRTHSKEAIRRGFYRNRVLGDVFSVEEGTGQYKLPGLATAIMLEFPERVKRVLVSPDEREILDYLPKRCLRAWALKEAFLSGLPWRSVSTISSRTDTILNALLTRWGKTTKNEALEVLIGLAARPRHPYSANRLFAFLGSMSMPARDLYWTEYLRQLDVHSVIERTIEWVERGKAENLSRDNAESLSTIIAMTLTTTNRTSRDRATRALIRIGKAYPDVLFALTKRLLDFNDPYVPERALGACYGVAMNLWASPNGKRLRSALPKFAKELTEMMLLPGANHSTKHCLARDYALGTIALARKVKPNCIATQRVKFLRRPFTSTPSPFPNPTEVNRGEVERNERALRMDFERYTLGRLLSVGRGYDYDNLRLQVLWRIANLGYDHEQFSAIDNEIGQGAWVANQRGIGKIDRYGKKYSWIAYFELYGVLDDEGLLPDHRQGQRSPDCDIDPSFPAEPPCWNFSREPVFRTKTTPTSWLRDGPTPDYDHLLRLSEVEGNSGPWVLLNGYIDEGAADEVRRAFTFLRGLIVQQSAVEPIVTAYNRVPYPGNQKIPDPHDEHYTYAGEIPWSECFGSALRTKAGRVRASIRPIFEESRDGKWRAAGKVEVPVCTFSWESYHSELNKVSGIQYPAPALCDRLGLLPRDDTVDLFDRRGKKASLFYMIRLPNSEWPSSLFYIREDLLRGYINNANKTLLWLIWGERNLRYKAFREHRKEINSILARFHNIHREWKGYA